MDLSKGMKAVVFLLVEAMVHEFKMMVNGLLLFSHFHQQFDDEQIFTVKFFSVSVSVSVSEKA